MIEAALGVDVVEVQCPYPGLRPFREEESHLFFGREGQAEELLVRLQHSRFLAVLGTSGSGKSSLVNAGLLPALRGDYLPGARVQWRIAKLRPGADPLERLKDQLADQPALQALSRRHLRQSSMALVRAMRDAVQNGVWPDDANVLIVVDQFEELFRYDGRDGVTWDERAAFVKLLMEASQAPGLPLYVILTMRSEYLGDCAAVRGLPEAINAGQYLIPRLSRENWRTAIESPARLMDREISPRLVQRLLNDVMMPQRASGSTPRTIDEADDLPLLQHALHRTWLMHAVRTRNTHDRLIDVEDYQRAGTMERALSEHLDEALADAKAQYGDEGERLAREVFQRLRVRDAKGREARDPVALAELCEVVRGTQAQVTRVIECFRTRDRTFITPEAPQKIHAKTEIDVPHECLLRRWEVLREKWTPEEEESRRMYLRLAQGMEEQTPVSGALLQIATEWWERRQPTAAWAKRYDPRFADIDAFLHKSIDAAAKERRSKEREQALKYGSVVAAILVGVALVALYFLYKENQAARESEANARRNWRLALSQLFGAKAQLASSNASSRHQAALLAVAAARHSHDHGEPPPIEAAAVLSGTVPWIPRPPQSIQVATTPSSLAYSGDGRILAIGDKGGTILIVSDPVQQPVTLKSTATPAALSLSRDGRYLVVTGNDRERAVEVWDVPKRLSLAVLGCADRAASPRRAVVSPDARFLMLSCGGLLRWDAARWRTGEAGTPVPWARVYSSIRAIDLSDRWTVVVGERSTGHEILAFDMQTRQSRTIALGDAAVTSVQLAGELVIATDPSGVRLWQTSGGDAIPVVLAGSGRVVAVSNGPEPSTLVTAAPDGTARLWDTRGREIVAFTLGRGVGTVALAPSTRRLAATVGNEVYVWSLGDAQDFHRTLVSANRTLMSATGRDSSISSFLSGLFFHDLERRDWIVGEHVVTYHRGRLSVDDSDGTWAEAVALQTSDPTRPTWSSGGRQIEVGAHGPTVAEVRGGRLTVQRVPFSREPAGASQWMWSVSPDPNNPLQSGRLLFSRNGRLLASVVRITVGGPQRVRVYDTETGVERARYELKTETVLGVLPEGHLLLRAGADVVDQGPSERRTIVKLPEGRPSESALTATTTAGDLIAVATTQTGSGESVPVRVVQVIRRDTAKVMHNWRIPSDVTVLKFSPDGRNLLTAAGDGSVRIWSTQSGLEESRLRHPGELALADFSSSGDRVIVVGMTHIIRYRWRLDGLVAEACARVTRSMTPAEWEEYIPQEFLETAAPYRCACSPPCPGPR